MAIVDIKGVGKAQFPDDMPLSDIRTFLQNRFKDLRTVAEPAAAILTGAVAEPLSGLAGLAASANPFAEPGAGARTVKGVQEAITYQPRSEEGLQGLRAVGEFMRPVGEYISEAEQNLASKVDSPLAKTIMHTLPTALMEIVGLKGISILKNPVSKGDLYSPRIFAGVTAKIADTKALSKAKNLESTGAGRDQIWKDTGWWNDSGDWKFEIDDSKGGLDPELFGFTDVTGDGRLFNQATGRAFKDKDIQAAYPELLDSTKITFNPDITARGTFRPGSIQIQGSGRQMQRSQDRVKDLERKKDKFTNMSDEQYAKEFDIEDIDEAKLERLDDIEWFDEGIARAKRADDKRFSSVQESTAKHELQHAIQNVEGFQRGGSPGQFEMPKKLIDESLNTWGNVSLLKKFMDAKGEEVALRRFNQLLDRDPTDLELNLAKTKSLDDIAKSQRELRQEPFESYLRLSGEAEARNVQTRLDWTPEKRKDIPPWESLDVPESELIRR